MKNVMILMLMKLGNCAMKSAEYDNENSWDLTLAIMTMIVVMLLKLGIEVNMGAAGWMEGGGPFSDK